MNKIDKSYTLNGILKTIGPGILYAGAAIGASHLVQSTRAGANYGFELIWAVILINIFKYPFFEFGHRFTAATGKSLIDGYRMIGRWAVALFFILNLAMGIINFAAVALVTTNLASFLFGIDVSSDFLSISLLALILLMMFIGKYKFLDSFMKLLIVVLAIATIIAMVLALFKGSHISPDFIPPEIWNSAGITFIIALMGWMPTPLEASAWPSLWAVEKKKQTGYESKFTEYMVDFHIGYIGSAVLALFFLGLGALVMYGTGESFAGSSVLFSQKFVSLYTATFGSWSEPLIAGIAFITIFTTALTVIDGYPRAIEASFINTFESMKKYEGKVYWFWALLLSILGAFIIIQFAENMKGFLDFATIVAFLSAPFFAIINYKIINADFFPDDAKPAAWLKILSWLGIIYLIGFSILFLLVRFGIISI